MTQIVVDAVTRSKLCQLDHPADLLDEEGRVLGRFLPAADLAEYEPLEPQGERGRTRCALATRRRTPARRNLARPGESGVNYTVLWVPAAEQALAAIWLSASRRNAVTRAAHAIDQELRTDPQSKGESRPGGRRVFISIPLGVSFEVVPQDMIVRVLHVWQIRRKGQQP